MKSAEPMTEKPNRNLIVSVNESPRTCKGIPRYINPGYKKFATGYPYP
jgi:hypothetical protein